MKTEYQPKTGLPCDCKPGVQRDKMKTFSHQRPVRDDSGAIISQKPAPASRVTMDPLGGQFGPDKKRRLVVTLKAGDVIELRPERTRQTVSILAVDVYRFALRCQAGRNQLEKARARKERLKQLRASRAISYADKKLRKSLKP